MEEIYGILDMALPVLVMLAVGVFLRKKELISQKGINDIKFFVLNVCLPAALFNTFYSTKLSWREGLMLLVMSAAMISCFLLGKAVCRILGLNRKSAPFLCCTVEGGGIGFPLFALMFGQSSLYRFALLDAGGSIIQWPVIMTMFMMMGRGHVSPKETVRSLVTPINIAILSGIVCSVTGLGSVISAAPIGQVLSNTLSFISAPTSAVMIMTVGYGLVFKDVNWSETLRTILARHGVGLIVGAAVLFITPMIFPGDPLYKAAVILYYTMPPTYVYSSLVTKEDESYVGAFLPFDTAFTILCYIVLTGILV